VLLLLSTPLAAAADVGGAYIVLLQDRLPAATAQASAFRAASPRRTARSAAAAAAAPASGLPWADGSVQPEEARAAAAAAVEAYEATLRAAQTDVLASVVDGGAVAIAAAAAARQQAGAQGQQQQLQQQQAPWLVHHYTAAVNGFAAAGLTTAQAAALRLHPSVQSVVPVRRVEATTYTTPAFLGLSGTGLWQSGWGGAAGAGQNVLIGVLDSGVGGHLVGPGEAAGGWWAACWSRGSWGVGGNLVGPRQLGVFAQGTPACQELREASSAQRPHAGRRQERIERGPIQPRRESQSTSSQAPAPNPLPPSPRPARHHTGGALLRVARRKRVHTLD
jgi:hypothetical protein